MNTPSGSKPFAKRSFGQNFLVDESYVRRIIAELRLRGDETVIEIGPGRGALTDQLVELAGKVVAVELDRDMIAILKERFSGRDNFTLVEADALEVDLAGLAGQAESAKLTANLPYYISTAILQKLIDQRGAFAEMVLMFQREVVDRITAPAGTSNRGFLTALVEEYFQIERLFDISPSAFRPVPKVWSSVVRLTPRTDSGIDPNVFRSLVSAAFAKKRKTILNNLKDVYDNAAGMLERAGVEPSRRAETLRGDEWRRLADEAGGGRKT